MQVVYERCCGLDVHKKSVTACVSTPEGKETRSFGTMTADLLGLADWLETKGVTHVAMESTGVWIWKLCWEYKSSLLASLGVISIAGCQPRSNRRPASCRDRRNDSLLLP